MSYNGGPGVIESPPEEEIAAERDLAEDAPWKKIQENTFTRWVNEHLKQVNEHINNLGTDFNDGLRLIALVSALSHKQLPKHSQKPKMRSQKLENVSVALRFLEHNERIKIVNIDSSDIVDCKLKLILGLIWTLILHYSIFLPMFEQEDQSQSKSAPTPKQRLLNWIQSKLSDIPIGNFTSDWNDGRAVGALVDAIAPGLCPDWSDWIPNNALHNAKEAMGLAEDWLGVPQLITPEEMTNPKVDEMSVMTYLSQFPNAKLKPGAPLRPRSNPNRVRAYGLGVEPKGVVEGAPASFVIDTFSAGKGEVDVKVFGPSGRFEPVEVNFSGDRKMIYNCSYTPKSQGLYTVVIKFNGHEIPKSPFQVHVEGHAGDATKVVVTGPGIEREGVRINRPTYFDIIGKDAGLGLPEVIILDPQGNRNVVVPKLLQLTDHSWRCEYTCPIVGLLSINVFFAGKPIPKSPFGVHVSPVSDARKVKASGRGLLPKGVRVQDIADFKVYTEGAGEGTLNIKVIGPGGTILPVNMRALDNSVFHCSYQPVKEGPHKVMISFGDQEIPKSPYNVGVGPYKESNIKAFGPGLEKGISGYPCTFTVYMNGETGKLGFSVEGPSQVNIDLHDNNDGSAEVTYYPTSPGEYSIRILCDDDDIPNSPYIAQISPAKPEVRPEMVESHGPGLNDELEVNKVTEFTVDTRKTGEAPLDVCIIDPVLREIPHELYKTPDGTFKCQYKPTKGVAVKGSPKHVNVIDPRASSKVHVFGPGIEKGVKTLVPTHFNIDAQETGPGRIDVRIVDEKGHAVPHHVLDHGDATYVVEYTAQSSGVHTIHVTYNDHEVDQSPFKVSVLSSIDLSKIRVDGLQPTMHLNATNEFLIDAKSISQTDGHVTCNVKNSSGLKIPCRVNPVGDGITKACFTPTEEGPHLVDIFYDGIPLPKSPAKVYVRPGCDPTKCRVYGPGVRSGIAGHPTQFVVNTQAAGTGGLRLAIDGPSKPEMTYKDNKDGSFTVEYTPTEPGIYDVAVQFADQHVSGSPFHVPVDSDTLPGKVRCFGPGVDPKQIRAEVPLTFRVDTSQAERAEVGVEVHPDRVLPMCEPEKVEVTGPIKTGEHIPASLPTTFDIDTQNAGFGNLDIEMLDCDNQNVHVEVEDERNGKFHAKFVPDKVGKHRCNIKYGNKEVPGSPFSVDVYPVGKAEKCVLSDESVAETSFGKRNCITVNTQQAGEGAVTARIYSSSTSEEVVTEVEEYTKGVYKIYYDTTKPGEYQSDIRFGGRPIKEGTRKIIVSEKVTEEQVTRTDSVLSEGSTVKTKEFRSVDLTNIFLPSTGGQVTAEVIMPSGKKDKPLIKDNRNGTISIHYDPKEEGVHEISIKYNGESISGSPFKFFVDSATNGYISAYGPGLTHGICGEPCNFTILTKDVTAGSSLLHGGLSLSVEGPSKADITCHDNKDGSISVSYLPTAPGEYKVTCKLSDKHIRGSPYTVKITGEGRKRNVINVGSNSEVSIPGNIPNVDIRTLNASICSPSGLEEPCFLKKLPNGSLGISFTPREEGEHVISVKCKGSEISESPFKIYIKDKEVGNSLKVHVSGNGLKSGKTHVPNSFIVDTKEAGYGGLSLSIEGPSKAEIKCEDLKEGKLKISYIPTEPGYYIINLKFADHHVIGSPFTVEVTGKGSNRQTERIKRHRDAVPTTEVGSKCKFTFRIPGVSHFDLSATVASPSGVVEDAEITESEGGFYSVNFVPKELGVHTVSVRLRGVHIPGSPFQFTVGPLKDHGAHRVHAGGPGLEYGQVNTNCEFNVWTREAGAGALSISVEGPSKANIDCKDGNDGSCYVIYKVITPSGNDDDCFIAPMDEDCYSIRFLPKENGIHLVHVRLNGVHVPGSPFRIKVGKDEGDPAAVSCHGPGLEHIRTGQKTDFIVDTCNAGAGTLAVTIDGPSRVSMNCSEVEEGYKVRYTPLAPGDYFINVKYNGCHVVGSPFMVKCTGKEVAEKGAQETSSVVVETTYKESKKPLLHTLPKFHSDASKVTCKGLGLKKAYLNKMNQFTVNTEDAVNPKNPTEEVIIKHTGRNNYQVSYLVKDRGEHLLFVKYGEDHIPGSPFKVEC